MRYASVAMALMALCLCRTAFGGPNAQFTLPLHVKPSGFEACQGYLPVDCMGTRPTTQVGAGPAAIFLFVNNHQQIAAVQTAFEWTPGWNLNFGLWDCQPGQLFAHQVENPGGPTAGTIATAFNCLNSPALAVIGRIHMISPGSGCVRQV